MSFQHAKVAGLVAPKIVLFDCSSGRSIGDVLNMLGEKNICSLPVYCESNLQTSKRDEVTIGSKQYIGIVSVIDLVTFVLTTASMHDNDGKKLEYALSRPVSEVVKTDLVSFSVECADASVFDAMENFSKHHSAIVLLPRRIAAAASEPPDETVMKLLTQTDICKFLSSTTMSASIQQLLGTPLCEIRRPANKQGIITITNTQGLKRALQTMVEAKLRAVPVVEELSGKLISTLSLSDFRGMRSVCTMKTNRNSKICILTLVSITTYL